MLEDKGVSYVNTADNLYGPEGMMDGFRGSPEAIQKDHDAVSFPILFPPAIWHRPKNNGEDEVLINQSAACMMYLGDVLGYEPKSAVERARANAGLVELYGLYRRGSNVLPSSEEYDELQ